MEKNIWQVHEPIGQVTLASKVEFHPLLVELLANRELRTNEAVRDFLQPNWEHNIYDPYLFRDMHKAVERIYESIGAKQKIAVFGDYDADGVTSAVILVDTLKKLGADALVYLPHREREGYGLNIPALNYFKEQGAQLVITCDCGIANVAEVAHGNSLGLEIIVTDHHQPQVELPKAYAILHPGLAGEAYPCKDLSGGGVAFKLVQGLLLYEGCPLKLAEREQHEKWLLDLVAISTVADMVPLLGENRTLVYFGLTVLKKTRRLGLKQLLVTAQLQPGRLSSVSIGYQIAPRINAAGRLDHANAAYALLMSQSEAEAHELARALNLTNSERQRISEEMVVLARERLGSTAGDRHILALYEPTWQMGMVGLVAGKLAQEYHRPVVIMCDQRGNIGGSGRGVPGFDLVAALSVCAKNLLNYGGHKQAAGFSLSRDSLVSFTEALEAEATKQLVGVDLRPIVNVDMELKLSELTLGLAESLLQMEPHGQGNPRPRFISYGLKVQDLQPVGASGQHLKLILSEPDRAHKFILFRQADLGLVWKIGSKVDVVYELGVNEWNGNQELELKIVDARIAV